jgi:inner membrane protein
MLAPTHSVFGMFMTLIILAVFGVQMSLHWSILLVAVLGALMPDIDIPKSFIGKIFWFISIPLERKFGHRTITHSLLGWVIATIIFSVIMLYLIIFDSIFFPSACDSLDCMHSPSATSRTSSST